VSERTLFFPPPLTDIGPAAVLIVILPVSATTQPLIMHNIPVVTFPRNHRDIRVLFFPHFVQLLWSKSYPSRHFLSILPRSEFAKQASSAASLPFHKPKTQQVYVVYSLSLKTYFLGCKTLTLFLRAVGSPCRGREWLHPPCIFTTDPCVKLKQQLSLSSRPIREIKN